MEATELPLPQDTLIKIVFFIEKWTTVIEVLKALRPAKVLGPLEHLWQLHFQLQWSEWDLWPRLDLSRIEAASRVHLEGIAKYYSQVFVDYETDMTWFRQFANPMASISWGGPSELLGEWPSFRITSMLPLPTQVDQLVDTFVVLPFLEEITWCNCTPSIAAAIFKFAASSNYFRRLELAVESDWEELDVCTITSSMGQDIVKWSRSCQIQKFYLEEFVWESTSLRNQVLGAVVSNSALEELRVFEPHDRTSATHEASFDRPTRRLTFGFRDPHGYDFVDVENWGGFFSLFEPVLATKVSYLRLTQLDDAGFTTAWRFLAPLVKHSHVEDLSLEFCNISNDDATEIARAIHDLTTIRNLTIYGKRPSFEGAKIILKAAPPSLKSENITIEETSLTEAFSLEECRELQILANERLCTAQVQRLDID